MRSFVRTLAMAAAGVAFGATVAHADLVIGIAGPMTGGEATFGAQFKAGGEMAVEEINAAGGILGQKVTIEIGDDACDAKQAVAVANSLASKKVPFVVGHFCSSTSIPASKVYEEEKMIQISPASTNPKLTDEGGPNVFRVCGRDDQQGGVAGELLATRFKDKNVAIIHDKTAYGQGLAEETKKAMNAKGKQEVLFESITKGEKDFSALVSKLKQAKVDVLYLGGYHSEGGLIVRQMRDQGMSTILMGGDALVTSEYWDITGPAGEGTLMTFSPDPRKNETAAEIVKRFEAKGVVPEGYVLYTYAAMQAFKQAAEKAKSTDYDKMLAVMKDMEYDTVLGKFSFDKKGDVSLPGYVVYEWTAGKYDYLK